MQLLLTSYPQLIIVYFCILIKLQLQLQNSKSNALFPYIYIYIYTINIYTDSIQNVCDFHACKMCLHFCNIYNNIICLFSGISHYYSNWFFACLQLIIYRSTQLSTVSYSTVQYSTHALYENIYSYIASFSFQAVKCACMHGSLYDFLMNQHCLNQVYSYTIRLFKSILKYRVQILKVSSLQSN